jgi:3-hydroxyisobutyrate dehydrogenase
VSEPERLGFIGLGQIGKPMARGLTSWAGGLTVCDAVSSVTDSFASRGVAVAATPADVASVATIISVMVRDDPQVRSVVTGADGILSTARPGTVIAIHSTVEADTPIELAAIAAEREVIVVDAPVSGGAMGAAGGTLALMVGGSADVVDRLRDPFAGFASLVAHCGPVGAGTRAKLARNLITFASFAAVGEAMALAEAAGVDLTQLGEVVRHSDRVTGGPGSIMLRPSAAPFSDDDGLRAVFIHTRGLGEKDLQLALGLGAELHIDLPVATQALRLLGPALGVPHQEHP